MEHDFVTDLFCISLYYFWWDNCTFFLLCTYIKKCNINASLKHFIFPVKDFLKLLPNIKFFIHNFKHLIIRYIYLAVFKQLYHFKCLQIRKSCFSSLHLALNFFEFQWCILIFVYAENIYWLNVICCNLNIFEVIMLFEAKTSCSSFFLKIFLYSSSKCYGDIFGLSFRM